MTKNVSTYIRGHKFFNGMPMSDQFADAIENYCKSARQKGDLRDKEKIVADWQDSVLKIAGVIKFKKIVH